jgi:hypothetical protein
MPPPVACAWFLTWSVTACMAAAFSPLTPGGASLNWLTVMLGVNGEAHISRLRCSRKLRPRWLLSD